MTINLLTAVQDDGLVMCADSMLTLTGNSAFEEPVTTTFESAEKIIELGRDLPAAAMINRSADIDGRLVSSFLRDISINIDGDASRHNHLGIIDMVTAEIDTAYVRYIARLKYDAAVYLSEVNQLARLNLERQKNGLATLTEVSEDQIAVEGETHPPADPIEVIEAPQLNIIVCTYFNATGASAEEIRWPECRRSTIVPGGDPLLYWGSGGSAVDRLVRGFDLELVRSHVMAGLSPGTSDEAQNVLDYATRFSRQYLMPTAVGAMPLQDAVEFTEYLGRVACGYDRFKLGPPGVGGELDILVLRREKRTWIRRKTIPHRLATS